MSKKKQQQVTGSFYAVIKCEHLLYEALEVEILNGEIQAVRTVSRAPDSQAQAVGNCASKLWERTLKPGDVVRQ